MTRKGALWQVRPVVLACVVFSCGPLCAETLVGGAITGNQTWTLANSPYRVTSTV